MGTAHRPTQRTNGTSRTTRTSGTTRTTRTSRTTTLSRTSRGAVAAGVALLAAAALGACSSGGDTQQTGAQAPVTATVTSTTTPATTSDGPASATTTSTGGAEAPGGSTSTASAASTVCQPSQLSLRVTMPAGGGSAGHVALQLVATNTGTALCTTQGYPGVSLVASTSGQQLGAAADRTPGQTPALVRLEPGKSAVATIQVAQAGNFPSCGETTAAGFRVYLPGTTAAAYAPYPIGACTSASVHQLQVQPFTS